MFTHSTIPIVNERSINSTMAFKNFHLSFNPSSRDYGCDTTAFVLKEHVFFIINGDHRIALSEIATQRGIDGCVDYLITNIALLNDKSEHPMAIGAIPDPFNLYPITLAVLGESNITRLLEAIQAQECIA